MKKLNKKRKKLNKERTQLDREQERAQQANTRIQEENKRRNEQREASVTPHRSKPTAKSGPSPKKPSPNKLEPVQTFPDGGEKASGSTDNPESAHEPKGRTGRQSNTQPTDQGPNRVRK